MDFDVPVIQIMSENPTTIGSHQKMSEARALLANERIHHLPVVENGKLVGILSSNDLVKLSMAYDSDDESLNDFLDRQYTVESVMQKQPITVGVEATVRDAALKLSAGGFHSLLVTGYDGKLQGIVTSTDMIEMLIDKL